METSVLIVEDEAAIVTLLRYNLEREGFRVYSTGDGEEAIGMVKDYKPDIIVLDWMLPSMSGVEIGRVVKIEFDSNEYKAVVQLRLNERYNKIPTDSDASIYTQGLLGGKFIGITAGGADTYLKDKGQIDFTQSAFVLENLIGQVLANFTKSKADAQNPAPADTKAPEKTK